MLQVRRWRSGTELQWHSWWDAKAEEGTLGVEWALGRRSCHKQCHLLKRAPDGPNLSPSSPRAGFRGRESERRGTPGTAEPRRLLPCLRRPGSPTMKLQVLVCTGLLLLLVALLPCQECRALSKSPGAAHGALHQPDFFPQQQQQQQTLPVLLRMGEEYFLRLGNLNKRPAGSFSASSSSSSSSSSHPQPQASATNFFRAAVQQLQQLPERSLGSPEEGEGEGEAVEREKRSEEPPISLDLTFHLLREVLEMARAEQLAQQAHSNRKLMEIIGK
uniref:Corticotropin releasing hormone n=2 Tax=Anatidae TaxID=8830 RepID=A0A8C3BRP1_CAIMO